MIFECFVCKTKEDNREILKTWEIQHLHFDDANLDVLTCVKCKDIHPYELLEQIVNRASEDIN